MTERQNLDTTDTKIYVAGLPWATRKEGLIRFFQQFGEITHANVVCDRQTQRSNGYGFVTFKDAESATRACVDPNPIIDGRRANCKLASDGENVTHNQFNITGYRLDDLCYLSQSYMQNQQQHANLQQPLPPYYGPYYWNQQYQQYHPQPHYYAPYHPQPHYYAPYHPQTQYYAPYHPQSQYVPNYPQSMNVPTENQAVSQASTSSSLASTPRSSLE